MSAEDYADKTQRAFVKTWSAAQDGYVLVLQFFGKLNTDLAQIITRCPISNEVMFIYPIARNTQTRPRATMPELRYTMIWPYK
jgi:hypothetical protein